MSVVLVFFYMGLESAINFNIYYSIKLSENLVMSSYKFWSFQKLQSALNLKDFVTLFSKMRHMN